MRIKEVLKELPLKYLVYEFIARDEISVERAIEKQEKIW